MKSLLRPILGLHMQARRGGKFVTCSTSSTRWAHSLHEPDSSTEPGFIKFPRTAHLYNLGRATRDDLIINKIEVCTLLATDAPNVRIVVQEKIDGANMGITLDQGLQFSIQNRSHYVNSKSHAQFKELDLWLQNHEADLWGVLTCNDTLQPGELIIFGEWVFAEHSIHYTKLPDFFIAFDLYDTRQKQFYSSSRLRDILKTTSLHAVHELKVQRNNGLSMKTAEQLVCTQSMYYNGMVEGVYVRWENDMWTVERAKVVRPDFVCGNKDWKKGQIMRNQLIKKTL
ncbi:hypothetical protein L7F22_055433 [Adiantum nelumboides]|nr:hypothetical protein [Adiantum nelumboides]